MSRSRKPTVRQCAMAYAMQDLICAMLEHHVMVYFAEPAALRKATLALYERDKAFYRNKGRMYREALP